MPSHPKLAAALIRWSSAHPQEYDAVVWSLVDQAQQQLRGAGGIEQGERQALYRRFDAVLRGAGHATGTKPAG